MKKPGVFSSCSLFPWVTDLHLSVGFRSPGAVQHLKEKKDDDDRGDQDDRGVHGISPFPAVVCENPNPKLFYQNQYEEIK